jgi:hypothetical protein
VGLALLPIGIFLSIQHNSEKIEFYYLIYAGVPFLLGTWLVKKAGIKQE